MWFNWWVEWVIGHFFSASCVIVTLCSVPQTLMKNWMINTIPRRGWSPSSAGRCEDDFFRPSFQLLCSVFFLVFFFDISFFDLIICFSFPFFQLFLFFPFFPWYVFLSSGFGPQRADKALSSSAPKGKLLPYALRCSDFKLAVASSSCLHAGSGPAEQCWSSPTTFLWTQKKLLSCYFAHLKICWICKSFFFPYWFSMYTITFSVVFCMFFASSLLSFYVSLSVL